MENKNFWHTEEGKILSHGVHDYNNAISALRRYIRIYVKDEEGIIKMGECINRTDEAINFIYEKIKEKVEKESSGEEHV